MTGIQFVTDEKGHKIAVHIDLKKHGTVLADFWDGLIGESRRKEKGLPLETVKADLITHGRLRESVRGRGQACRAQGTRWTTGYRTGACGSSHRIAE